MAAATNVKTTVEELPESRVRVAAEVTPQEVQRRVNEAAGKLGRDLRMPGFRKGKVPAPVVIQRVGREAVLDDAVRATLPRWYVEAIDEAGLKTVGEPDVELGDLPAEGQPLTFTIEIGVRPTATIGDIAKLDVTKREAEVDDAAVDEQIETLRQQLGRLETVEKTCRERRLRRHRLQGLDRRRGRRARLLLRRRGPRPPARARLRPVHPRLRGAARRAEGRRREGRRAHLPRGLRLRAAPRRPARPVRGHRQRGQGQAAARARRRLRHRGRRL